MKQTVQADLWEIERACKARGYQLICGADEAGAGPALLACAGTTDGWSAGSGSPG